MKKLLLLLLVFWAFVPNIQAQTISYPTTSESITRGYGTSLLTVKIDFPAGCTNPTVTINLGADGAAGEILYVPGTLEKIDGTASLDITEGDITDLSNPQFLINTPNAGEDITFTIERRANCGSTSASKDNILVSGGCSFSDIDANINSYNINSPALSVTAPTSLQDVDLGVAQTRSFSVTNGGDGCLDTLLVWINYPAGSATLNSLKIGSTTLTEAYTNGDSTLFKISGADLGVSNALCNGGTVTLTEEVTYLTCNATETEYGTAWKGFDDVFCQADVQEGNMTMSNNLPSLKTTLTNPDDVHDFCYRGDTRTMVFRITNTGAGAATDVRFRISNDVPGSTSSPRRIDTTGGFVIKDEAGAVISTTHSFSNFGFNSSFPGTFTTGTNTSCSKPTFLITTIASLGEVIIPAGEYVDVEVKMQAINLSCGVQCNTKDIYSWFSMQGHVEYQNQCKTATYTENNTNFFPSRHFAFRGSVEHLTDISSDPPNNTFDYMMNFTILQTTGNQDGTGEVYLGINTKNTGLSPGVTSVVYDGYTLPVEHRGDTLIAIGPLPNNRRFDQGSLSIPMVASCSSGSGVKTISSFLFGKYSSCAPTFYLGCKTSTINVHCSDPCPIGGATPLYFNLKRINRGLADTNNDGIPDDGVTLADPSVIMDHRSVNGDTLQGTWNIKVFPNAEPTDPHVGQDFNYVYIDFKLTDGSALGSNGSLQVAGPGTATIYPADQSPSFTREVTPTITNDIYAHYELGHSIRESAWQANDSIVFEADFTAVESTSASSGGFTLFTTSNEVYSTYTQKMTNQTASVAGETYTCDHYNDYSQIARIWWSPHIPPNQTITGCSGAIESRIRQYTRLQEGANTFPNEYRNFYIPSEMWVIVPPGAAYRAGTAKYSVISTAGANNTSQFSIPDALVSQVEDTVFFNLQPLYTPYGGGIIPADEQYSGNISFNVNPTCETTSGTFVSMTSTSGIGNALNTPFEDNNLDLLINTQNNGFVVRVAQPKLTGGSTQSSTDGTATWNLVL